MILEPMDEYTRLAEAFDFFNFHLFGDALPDVLISFRAKKTTHGSFRPEWLKGKDNNTGKLHEITLNLASADRPDIEVLSTLVHEMVHLWEEEFGPRPPKGNWHTRVWADKMHAIGLAPYNVKEKDKDTGVHVTHTIMDGGHFQQLAQELLDDGWRLQIFEPEEPIKEDKRAEQQRKRKYECPGCGMKVWGKPNLYIRCGDCDVDLDEAV